VTAPEILRRTVRRFGLLLLLTLLGGAAGAIYAAVKTPTYTAKAYLVAAGDPIAALNYAQAYGRIAATGPVLTPAGATLGADRSGLSRVTASTSPDAPVVEISATGPSPVGAAAVANAVATSLIAVADTRKADTKVSLAVLAAATPPARPTSPRPPMETVIGAAGGLLVAGLAVLAGVGRPAPRAEVIKPDLAPPPEVVEPDLAPHPEIDAYVGVQRPKELPAATVDGRIVGRAVVFRMEEK